MLRRIVAVALSAGIALLAGLAGAEAWLARTPLQVDGWPPRSDNTLACMQPSLSRGYAPLPDACGRDADGAIRLGAPGSDPASILLLGDSISTHPWVPATAARLAAALGDRGLDLRNAAVSGYDACQEAATWAERGLNPDLLVLQTCPNDLTAPTPALVRVPGDRVRYYGPDGAITIPAILVRWRVTTALALTVGHRWALEPAPPRDTLTSVGCLDTLRESAAQAGVPLVVLEFPSFEGKPPRGLELTLAQELRRRPMDVIDIRALLAARDPALLVSRDGVHPDTPAHAEALADLLTPLLAARLAPR